MDLGFADLHNHQFANLGFGGKLIWGSPYGDLNEVLTSCADRHGWKGWHDVVGNAMRLALIRRAPWHGVDGSPGFSGWPSWDSFTHQTVHEQWLRRAVDGGLRLMVMLAVNNEWVSHSILRVKDDSADDMKAVDAQLEAAKNLEHLIDERCGGPGLGWYRIVTSADQARRVIADGRLAVVLGIEVDRLFGAGVGTTMSTSDLVANLDKYHQKGVRHLFPIHFGDNGFGGGSFDNAMIRDRDAPWVSRRNPPGTLWASRVRTEDARAAGYEYRTGRRNPRGLSPLGRTLIRELIARGMTFDLDHMSARARKDTLEICSEHDYPPVAGHAGFLEIARYDRRHERQLARDDLEWVRDLGGMIGLLVDQGSLGELAPWPPDRPTIPLRAGSSANALVQAYLYAKDRLDGAPIALGSDLNGFARLPGPRYGSGLPRRERGGPPVGTRVEYPFRAISGVRLGRSRIGDRDYDVNTDGVAHVGMLPDLIADFSALGVPMTDLAPLAGSAAGFVDLWSRAESAAR